MQGTKTVWIGLDDAGNPVTIFKNHKQAIITGVCFVPMLYGDAVVKIRRTVFTRDNFACTHCSKPVTWDGDVRQRGHMHEREWRGHGGAISVANSVTLCYDCHMNDPVAGHGKRKVMWGQSGKM